jgi:hypothetical protein
MSRSSSETGEAIGAGAASRAGATGAGAASRAGAGAAIMASRRQEPVAGGEQGAGTGPWYSLFTKY